MQRLRQDDGAVAVIVAIVMVALLGLGALVIDAGSLYAERRQLQNGADAGALAAVIDCATPAGCATTAAATAAAKANQNANDALSAVASPSGPAVCGSGGGLQPCAPESGLGPWDCRPPTGPLGANYVQVRTQTQQDGSTLMPPFLARVLNPAYEGATVRACARASWGPPSGLTSQLPLTISLCEFQQYTSAGFSPPPPYPSGYAGERTIYFHNNADDAPPCPAGPSGADLPGGFGWLNTTEDCVATTNTANWVQDSTGVPPPNSCSNAELLAMRGQVINVPIYDETNGLNGSNGEYHLVGYAAFYLTGYVFPSAKQKSLLTNAFPCSGPDHCISGVFTQDLSPTAGTIGSGPYMGSTVVQMSG